MNLATEKHINATHDKVVFISGASKRIGAAIARHLHAHGYRLALHCQHSRQALDDLVNTFNCTRADSALALQADLANSAQLPLLIEHCVQHFGRLDGLVNNASAFFPTPFANASVSQFEQLFAVNVRAPYFLAQAARIHLQQQNGAIINLTDYYARTALAHHSLYTMSKAALVQMTRALALEFAPHVRVNAIAPGAILWPEHPDAAAQARQQAILQRTALARIGTVEEIADAVYWLLAQAQFVTGQEIAIDGGRHLYG